MTETISLNREPIVECPCGNQTWYLIANPTKNKIPEWIIAFECTECKARLTTNIKLED